MELASRASNEFCSSLQFDFANPDKALRDFYSCRGIGSFKDDQELLQRFASGWAHFAANNGVGSALRVLADPGVRHILVPMDDWPSLVSHITGGQTLLTTVTSSMHTVIVLQIVTVVAIALSSIFLAVFVWKKLNTFGSYSATQPVQKLYKRYPGEQDGLLHDHDQKVEAQRVVLDYNE